MKGLWLLIAALLAWVLFFVASAHSHHGADWVSTGGYTTANGVSSCCGERDCEPIPDEFVTHDGQDHFIVRWKGHDWRFPEKHTQLPKAEHRAAAGAKWWGCWWGGELKCLFRPSFGG